MITPNRYLRFQTIDVDEPTVCATCSQCGKEFVAERESGESLVDVLHRTRTQFDAHKCDSAQTSRAGLKTTN